MKYHELYQHIYSAKLFPRTEILQAISLPFIEPVPVEPVERFRQNRQGHHTVCSPHLWLDQSNKELWLAVE